MNNVLPEDYADRVYAGVLGKVIGVYLGRPFEGWTYERIQKQLGDIEYYVHDKLNLPLIVSDDDISGTFTFIRSLADHNSNPDITAVDIGNSWLNYIIENRSILWWGGMGNSTEHTAFLRLKNGVKPPLSGSEEMNGKVVAEQIGAQIFIDGWAMVAPGNPDQAARLAEVAARVSHDGEAVYGAVVLAVMESLAFVENDIQELINKALKYIPRDSVIRQLIDDVRTWHARESDWRATRELLAENYGYDKYGGNCHMVPNHGLIIHSLLHGEDDFSRTMKIVNTCGWDTDCNSGNVGCLMGIKNGLSGIDDGISKGFDWRSPIADRIYLPTAEGGRGISDCAHEALEIVNLGRSLAGEQALRPKKAAQFHFEFPGSVQGFTVTDGAADVTNVTGHSDSGERSLQIRTSGQTHCGTPVFAPSKEIAKYFEKRGYGLTASPRIYPGQSIESRIITDAGNTGSIEAGLYINYYGEDDEAITLYADPVLLAANQEVTLQYKVPKFAVPVFETGVFINSAEPNSVYLDYLTWAGEPDVRLGRPRHKGTMWRRAWVSAVDTFNSWQEPIRLVHNQGTGLLIQGTRQWRDYKITADVRPHLVKRAGIAARVQGLKRYYALLLAENDRLQLIRMLNQEEVLAECEFPWQFGEAYDMALIVDGHSISAEINGNPCLSITDNDSDLLDGSIALVVDEGRTATESVSVIPLSNQ
ncbi:MAG TPA: ADP-ribosylglycohydrolase family protein [Pseudomonadales bacterium]|jgi:ADP-ribosylglycohydrolase|nr:hypothetical protein [Gammaproteobacteria bacterium]MDP6025120.1 ADP-ribosylglycohydrolase family protein [Pseudomonadales bacterium]MDP6315645.1 ADP-ribosylglycohydrolase family protein [Pseudomonadales bacterium]MDP7313557.1 ADP-ribosylglycohydrolase family protein [Pseudomonadales bacterium]MDP7576004.1 ADP-ribosylglycohydrolase family protein [Pseudomonadales bacterium]|tara:strand:- start:1883 stop:3988 length:2106 start_codon:yes stop_codon:yes gene_type:complete